MKLSFQLAALTLLTSGALHWLFIKDVPVTPLEMAFTGLMASLAFWSGIPKRAR